jgi:sec-independent protein translocase protein TatA
MGFGSPLHWIIVILVIVLLFGAGRVSGLMGEVAKGIKSFKKGMADDDEPEPRRLPAERTAEIQPPPQPTAQPAPPPAAQPAPVVTPDPAAAPDSDRPA